jgi:hypothetical protein
MATLSAQQQAEVNASFMHDETTTFGNILKADLLAAVVALDSYFDTNASAINQALPATARSALTMAQKSRLVRYVIEKRYG